VNGDTPLVAASMIKLPVLAEFLYEVESGKISMDEPYTLREKDIVGGTGSVQSSPAGMVFTYAELARLMICESDNVAANVLIERMGMDAVNARAEQIGLSGTRLVRLLMDENAQANRKENLMSAEDAAVLLALIWHGQLADETASKFALEALEAQSDTAGILQGLPKGTVFAHKTGTLAQVRNDGGIIEAAKPYVLVVFCSGAEESTALDLMSRISELVHDRYE
jgi:beta-lactamase class A